VIVDWQLSNTQVLEAIMIKQIIGWIALVAGLLLVLFSLFAKQSTLERFKAEANATSWKPYQTDPMSGHPRFLYFLSGTVVALIGTWILNIFNPILAMLHFIDLLFG
jgi:predicted histidine transporter YuiF (NhaC family)